MDKYIITGGPGSGKTNLLGALKYLNYNCSAEASRQLIIQETEKKSACLPWLNLECFAEKVLDKMISLYNATTGNRLTFYDRGIPDIIAYLEVAGLPVTGNYFKALQTYPYNKNVFILPPWQEIYVNDSERWQTYKEAEQLYWGIMKTYTAFGFNLIEVPRLSVDERVEFVLNNINDGIPNCEYLSHAK